MKKIVFRLSILILISGFCSKLNAQTALSGSSILTPATKLGWRGYSGTTGHTVNGVVNRYWKVTAFTAASGGTCSAPATLASMTVGAAYGNASPASLTVGMEVLIIQMTASSSTGVIDRTLTTSAYGNVSNFGGAGNYEFAVIASIAGSVISFTKQLVNTYDPVNAKVQLIPTWLGNTASTNYTTSNDLRPMEYDVVNGVGGVFVLSTTGTLTLSNNINADSLGFPGGDTLGYAASFGPWGANGKYIESACCGSFVTGGGTAMDATNAGKFAFGLTLTQQRYTSNPNNQCDDVADAAITKIFKGSRKGWGVFEIFTGEELSKGKLANGGGGGHGYNSGGGGGGGYSGGGQGGYELRWACNNGGTSPAGMDHGGRGGLGITGGATTLFMGGGGGAGHGDGNSQSASVTVNTEGYGLYPAGYFEGPTKGGDGGGIVIIKVGQIIASGQIISARGAAPPRFSHQDASGGGGGGGTIILEIPTYSGTLSIDASGGNGGNTINPNSSDCHGTGGGGGGGKVIFSQGAQPAQVTSVNTNGGLAGKLLYISGNSLLTTTSAMVVSNCGGVDANWGSISGTATSAAYNTNVNMQTCSAAPVTLLNFSAKLFDNGNVGISWLTSVEINSSYFIIERSSDGINYEAIGTAKAKGKSNQFESYFFKDSNVVTTSGFVYYRLKIIDLDDTFEYSRIASIKLSGTLVSVYPNPINREEGITIRYMTEIEGEVIVEIVDILGRPSISSTYRILKGINEFNFNTNRLAKGIYLIYIKDNFGKTMEKLIIE